MRQKNDKDRFIDVQDERGQQWIRSCLAGMCGKKQLHLSYKQNRA